jgi:hypothetical protein
MQKEGWKKLGILGVFAVAMAFLEAVVVIYLRKIFYPMGFDFPLKGFLNPFIWHIEWLREIATIIILACIAMLAGKKVHEKLAYFIFSFAVWDIFYYIWLKAALGWPSSLMAWDLLFLIPWSWVSPVLAPLIISLTFIALSLLMLEANAKLNTKELLLFIFGSLAVIYTFLYDYGKIIISGGFAKDFFSLAANPEFGVAVSNYAPTSYNWVIFALGEALILLSCGLFFLRNFRKKK